MPALNFLAQEQNTRRMGPSVASDEAARGLQGHAFKSCLAAIVAVPLPGWSESVHFPPQGVEQ